MEDARTILIMSWQPALVGIGYNRKAKEWACVIEKA